MLELTREGALQPKLQHKAKLQRANDNKTLSEAQP